MSELRNLKDGTAKLLYYRERPTGKRTPKNRTVRGKQQSYFEEELERLYFEEDVIRQLSLDKFSQNLPYRDGDLTIIHNYIFDYWGYFLKAEGLALYGHLKRYCYGDKDYCWPNLELIGQKMRMSRNTVKTYIDLLESYSFIIKFNVQNADKDNNNESPLFKVRKKVPLLSQELIDQLPRTLHDDHERYLQKLMSTSENQIDLDPSIDYNEFRKKVEEQGKAHRKPKQLSLFDAEQMTAANRKLLRDEQTEEDKARWSAVLDKVREKVAKATFDTWFKDTFAIKRDGILTVFTPNSFVKEWLQDRLGSLITESVKSIDPQFYELKFQETEFK
ncbi:helix-turn-helix domain-containing protein [Paenibacillus gansuensis]|uniref:DnaA N-terminal domain-containing protein n=1 Tax=Paenibacillus gansuensis TaxID=306542 RepID=A0ABW5PIG3_9BACL